MWMEGEIQETKAEESGKMAGRQAGQNRFGCECGREASRQAVILRQKTNRVSYNPQARENPYLNPQFKLA